MTNEYKKSITLLLLTFIKKPQFRNKLGFFNYEH